MDMNEVVDTFMEHQRLQAHGRRTMGRYNWSLLLSQGRTLAGPQAGSPVTSLPTSEVRRLLDVLASGENVPIHLTHKDVTGKSEPSRLRLVEGRLVMVYADREEFA